MKALTGESRCLVIAEVAQAHDGSLGAAHAYIDAAARAGAGAIKFQTHIAAAESSLAEPWRVKFSMQDATRYDYWRRMEFTEEQWAGLRAHAEERGLVFLSSPFSVEAAEMLRRVGVRAWKIASGEVNNTQLFEFVAGTRMPVLLSTGMSRLAEIDRAVERVRATGCPVAVLQCTTAYPCPEEKIGLNMLPFFERRYGCEVGLSDHSGKIYPGLAAVVLGAAVIEVHITFSRECFGPDVPASLTTVELKMLVEGVRSIEKALASPVDKDAAAADLENLRGIFTKSVVVRVDLPAGAALTAAHLGLKKPGTGIPAERLPDLVGRRLRRPMRAGEFLAESDLYESVISPAVA